MLPEEGHHGLLALLHQFDGQVSAAGVEHLIAARAVVDRPGAQLEQLLGLGAGVYRTDPATVLMVKHRFAL